MGLILAGLPFGGWFMASQQVGLSLHDAARAMGVVFTRENEPVDRDVRVNGMNFHYLEWGDAGNHTVLMLHGNSQQAHSWDFASLPLSEHYRVIALDQRGHGDSDWAPDGDYSLEAQVGDLAGFVEVMGLDDFTLIGHSMGGRNSYVWASGNSEKLRGLVIVDTGPETQRRGSDRIRQFRELPDELDSFEEFAQRVMEYTGRTHEQVVGALKYSIRERADGKWTWKYDKAMRNRDHRPASWSSEQLWEAVAKITCPTLVVRGDRSDLFSEETMRRMADVIPNCATVTIARAGHLVQGDNPPDFNAAALEFLRQVN